MKYKRHKYDSNNKCIRCGVVKRIISMVGNGFNMSLRNKVRAEYSNNNGITFQGDEIECIDK